MRFGALVAAMALACVPAVAESQAFAEARKAIIMSYVFGLGLDKACSKWRINQGKALDALALAGIGNDDFQPGGKWHDEFMRDATLFKTQIAGQDDTHACDMADEYFGPDGTVVKGWMKLR